MVTMGTASVAVAQTPVTFAPHVAKDKAERTVVPVVVAPTRPTLFSQALAATTRHVATARAQSQKSWASRHPGRVVGIILAAALGVMLVSLAYRLSKE